MLSNFSSNVNPLTKPPVKERREHDRVIPETLIPILFSHASAKNPTAGFIQDIGEGGAKIVAPPTARPMLHWGDPFRLTVSYSESTRAAAIEGLQLSAYVVRIVADREQFALNAAFSTENTDTNWTRLHHWLVTLVDPTRNR